MERMVLGSCLIFCDQVRCCIRPTLLGQVEEACVVICTVSIKARYTPRAVFCFSDAVYRVKNAHVQKNVGNGLEKTLHQNLNILLKMDLTSLKYSSMSRICTF
jgi:hypothetical protein